MNPDSNINKNRVAEEVAILFLVNQGLRVNREVVDRKRYIRVNDTLCFVRSNSIGPFPCGRADNSAVGVRFDPGDYVIWTCTQQKTCKLWRVNDDGSWREVW